MTTVPAARTPFAPGSGPRCPVPPGEGAAGHVEGNEPAKHRGKVGQGWARGSWWPEQRAACQGVHPVRFAAIGQHVAEQRLSYAACAVRQALELRPWELGFQERERVVVHTAYRVRWWAGGNPTR